MKPRLLSWLLLGSLVLGASTVYALTAPAAPAGADADEESSDVQKEEPPGGVVANTAPTTDDFASELLSPLDTPVYHFIGDTVLVQLTAKNDTSLRSVRLFPLGLANSMFESAGTCSVAGQARKDGSDELPLAAGKSIMASCAITPRQGGKGWSFSLFSKGTSGTAVVQIEKAAGENSAWEVERIQFTTEPIFLSPLSGAICGSLVLGLFAQFVARKSSWKSALGAVAIGTLVAIILMFGLSAFAGEGGQGLPINVTVADFRGGFLIGLFAHLLREKIAEKLHIKTAPHP